MVRHLAASWIGTQVSGIDHLPNMTDWSIFWVSTTSMHSCTAQTFDCDLAATCYTNERESLMYMAFEMINSTFNIANKLWAFRKGAGNAMDTICPVPSEKHQYWRFKLIKGQQQCWHRRFYMCLKQKKNMLFLIEYLFGIYLINI